MACRSSTVMPQMGSLAIEGPSYKLLMMAFMFRVVRCRLISLPFSRFVVCVVLAHHRFPLAARFFHASRPAHHAAHPHPTHLRLDLGFLDQIKILVVFIEFTARQYDDPAVIGNDHRGRAHHAVHHVHHLHHAAVHHAVFHLTCKNGTGG